MPTPTFSIASSKHRCWLQPVLERYGWRSGSPANATFFWQLTKKLLPRSNGATAFNCLPNLLLLDDKAVLALLTRRFTRTRPLVTHVNYGEWDDTRIESLNTRWSEPGCDEPRWWIIKDAHSSNGFSAALFDRSVRPLHKTDVSGGYCYVVQEYVERPLLVDGRKFEMRQYVLICGDGSAYTYDGALMRLACVPYEVDSTDRRAHITNKWVQTGWEASNELGATLDDLERLASEWPPYAQLLDDKIVPLVSDLADAVIPLLTSGQRAQAGGGSGGGSPHHFELMACDLVVTEEGEVHLMEVNINPAFGAFLPRTEERLIKPLFEDLLTLCVLPTREGGGLPARAGRFRRVRAPGLAVAATAASGSDDDVVTRELQAHLAYVTFKKSSRKRYEHKVGDERPLVLSAQPC